MPANGYILPDELPLFYDLRRILQLASDTDDTPATEADLSNTASDAYAFLNNAILSASSDLDQHCQQGKRYTRVDLEAIVAAANASPNDSALVKRAQPIKQMVADLAFGIMLGRRGFNSERLASLAPRYEKAQEALEKLALGILVFDISANIEAGVPDSAYFGVNNYLPSRDNRMFGVWCDTPQGPYGPSFFGRW